MNIPAPSDLLDMTDAVVIVTGAGAGIGAGVALRFAQAGAHVVMTYRSNPVGTQIVAQAVEKIGQQAKVIQADLREPEDVTRVFYETEMAFGRVSALINNAGIYPQVSLVNMTVEEWDTMMATNLRSVFLCTQTAARQMMTQSNDLNAIINIASIEGEVPAPLHSHYVASKAAVIKYTEAAAQELGSHGIRVNAVSPGLIWREGIEENWPDGVARWTEKAPLTRLGQPEDVADACLFLVSRAARWITGVNLRVDGGMLVSPYM